MHWGVDFAAPVGEICLSANNGKVSISNNLGGYRLIMQIQNERYSVFYAHCSELLKEVGSTVKQGDPVCKVGSTGTASGPHSVFPKEFVF